LSAVELNEQMLLHLIYSLLQPADKNLIAFVVPTFHKPPENKTQCTNIKLVIKLKCTFHF